MPNFIKNQESYIHDRVLQDLIAAHLQAISAVTNSEEVLDLTLSIPDHSGLRTISYKTIKTKEVELIVHT